MEHLIHKFFVYHKLYETNKRAWIFIGTLCNSYCPFCYYKEDKSYFHSLECIKKQIDCAHLSKFTSIDISGGEPLLHPEIEDVISYAKDKGLQVGIVTNSCDTDKLNTIVDKLDDILISWHGDTYHKSYTLKDKEHFLYIVSKHFQTIRFNITVYTKDYDQRYIEIIRSLANDGYKIQINILPVNSWTSSKVVNTQNRLVYAINFLHRIQHLLAYSNIEVNIRYVPYCIFSNYSQINKVGFVQHIFDTRDWHLSSYKIHKLTCINNLYIQALRDALKEIQHHYQPQECKLCKYKLICDKFQTKEEYNSVSKLVSPIQGNVTYDPLKDFISKWNFISFFKKGETNELNTI